MPEKRYLVTPGPTPVPPEVLAATAAPMIHHRSPDFRGTLERVTPTLTSDPPLSSLQILALLAGQEESEVANLTQTQARQGQAQLAAAGAATLAAGRISESMGLEREAERLFGLNRFSIDPSLLRGAGTTTARVTVGKRITPDLNVLYSQDLRGTEERILAVEYTLTDRFSLLLTRTRFGRWVKKYHLWHHFKNEQLWFGVTNPSMDVLGRTYRRVEDVERSPNVRILFPDSP